MKVVVLAGAARHPLTQLACRGRDDAGAVELSLQIAKTHGAHLQLIHCGSPEEPTLRSYFGMGVPRIVVVPADADLAAYLVTLSPALVVTGSRSGFGTGEGLLPYRIAAACGWPLIPSTVGAEVAGDGWSITQHRARGARRFIMTSGPTVITVGEGASPPRQSAYARARAGKVEAVSPASLACPPADSRAWVARPARDRPASSTPSGSAAERRRAFLQPGAAAGRVVVDLPPADMARELLQRLEQLGVRER